MFYLTFYKRKWQNVASAEKVHLFPDRLRSRLVRGCLPLTPVNDIFEKYENIELFRMLIAASIMPKYRFPNKKMYSFSSLASVSEKIRIFSTLASFQPKSHRV